MNKPMTILVDARCNLTAEILPQWRICRDLAFRLNQHIGEISIRFDSTSYFSCEFRWRDKCIGIIETSLPNGEQFSPRIRASRYQTHTIECVLGLDVPGWLWQNIFRSAVTDLILAEYKEKLAADLP